ncbi:hypothetical protein SESBI_49255 [Sesbania bispinosa]|nr:hypothetical protein SESBI_49255 [Sesbania bispinosa]
MLKGERFNSSMLTPEISSQKPSAGEDQFEVVHGADNEVFVRVATNNFILHTSKACKDALEKKIRLQLQEATLEGGDIVTRSPALILYYEDARRPEVAQKTVPMEELEEKALVSLAKPDKHSPGRELQAIKN